MFDLMIENPNRLSLSLTRLEYDFLINGNTFVEGDQEKGVRVEANGQSGIQLPISIGFADLYDLYSGVKGKDFAEYQINCGFSFEVPVLGVIRIPVSKKGDFPLPKRPEISLDGIHLSNISVMGANLMLKVKVRNPNPFTVDVKRLFCQLDINGNPWFSGAIDKGLSLLEKGESTWDIPLSLNFLELGQSVYSIVKNSGDLNYGFSGSVNISTPLPLLEDAALSFDRSGRISITR
jgi:LEA14-like dessication related protein